MSETDTEPTDTSNHKFLTQPWLRMRYGSSKQETVDDASKNVGPLYETREGVPVRIPFSMLYLIEYAIPSDKTTLVTGFGEQPIETRLKALERFIALGGTISGDMVLAARKSPTKIFAFLLENGGRICDSNGKLLKNDGSVFNNAITTPENMCVVLEHIHKHTSVYSGLENGTESVFTQIADPACSRLPIVASITCKDTSVVAALVYILLECHKIAPELTVKFAPTSPSVRAILLVDHNIAYPATSSSDAAAFAAILKHRRNSPAGSS